MLHEKVLGSKNENGVLTDIISHLELSGPISNSKTIAETFIESQNRKSTDLTSFLNDKVQLERSETALNAGVYQNLFVFNDLSIVVQKTTGEYTALTNLDSIKALHKELSLEMIREAFKKTPNTMKGMIEIADKIKPTNMPVLADIISDYKSNIDILKLYNVNIVDTYNNISKVNSDDKLNELKENISDTIQNHKIKQYGMSVSSKKYEGLYDHESFAILRDIYLKEIPLSDFKQKIGPNMAKHFSPSDFNNALKDFLKEYEDFTIASVVERAAKHGLSPVCSDDNSLLFKIDNFEQSKEIGSNMWAISKMAIYFDMYTDKGKEQYFSFDFTKKANDPASLIGVTIDKGVVFAAHYKDCVDVKDEDLETIVKRIKSVNDTHNVEEKKTNSIKHNI